MNQKSRPLTTAVTTEEQAAIMRLCGEINGEADDSLNAAYSEAAQNKPQRIVIDFSDVDYINSTGIALIVGLLGKARAANIPLIASGLSSHYREIFTITRLADFIELE